MPENNHASRVADQLAVAEENGEELRVIEVPITLHRNDQGLHAWVDEDAVEEDTAGSIDIEEIERRLFNRFPEVLLQNAEENLTPEWKRRDDAPRFASAEFYPEVSRIGGVTVSMDQRAQWAMIPRSEGGDA